MYPRILRPPEQSFFLFGVRGVGKSTWVRSALPEATRFDLLDNDEHNQLAQNPSLFEDRLRAVPEGGWVVVDEVQRLPELLNEVHRFIEERGLRFALLGSSARSLRRAGVNLLGGRALRRNLLPLVPAELGSDFTLERALRYGTIALVVDSQDPEATLRAWVEVYLREEIQAEAQLRNLSGFLRFLPVAAVAHAQVLNVTAIARDAAVSRTTVEGYLSVLEDTLVARRLSAFSPKLRVKERRLPKLFWVDPGLVRATQRRFTSPEGAERGHLFEGWLLGLLEAHNVHHQLFEEISYWSPHQSNLEVDFVLRRGGEFIAIEAKATRRFLGRQAKGLVAFGELVGVRRRIMVYLGAHRLATDSGIEVLPLPEFLDELAEDRLWAD